MAGASKPYLKLALLGALFLLLTAAGIAWAVHGSGFELAQLERLGDVAPGVQAVVIGLSLGLLLADMLRFRVAGAAIGVKVSWIACWDATVANFFFAWITPGSAMADPATIYVLGRRGVPWDAATVLSFGKSITGLLLLLGVTFALLIAGLGPKLDKILFLPFVSGTAVLGVMALTLVAGAVWPEGLSAWVQARRDGLAAWRMLSGPRATRALDALSQTTQSSIRRLAEFRRSGFQGSAAMLASHLLYYSVFVGVLVALASGFGAASAWDVVPTAVIYHCFTYVLPTPGGSGLSEGTAVAFFGELLDPRSAVIVVLLFRALTFYFHVLLGLVYLPLIGALRAVLEQRGRPEGQGQVLV